MPIVAKNMRWAMFERFTDRARDVMATANKQAQELGHNCIGTEHLFLGLLEQDTGTGATILKERGVDAEKMLGEIGQLLHLKGKAEAATESNLPDTPSAVKVVQYAAEEARALKQDHIGTEHLLLGLLRETDGIAAQVLANLGVRLEDVRESLA
jgi:ATP-dependent Clp protease ATP-binding subunit ClpC